MSLTLPIKQSAKKKANLKLLAKYSDSPEMHPSLSRSTPSPTSSSRQSLQRRADSEVSSSGTSSFTISPESGLDSCRGHSSPQTWHWGRAMFPSLRLQTKSWSMHRGYSHNSRMQVKKLRGLAPIWAKYHKWFHVIQIMPFLCLTSNKSSILNKHSCPRNISRELGEWATHFKTHSAIAAYNLR